MPRILVKEGMQLTTATISGNQLTDTGITRATVHIRGSIVILDHDPNSRSEAPLTQNIKATITRNGATIPDSIEYGRSVTFFDTTRNKRANT